MIIDSHVHIGITEKNTTYFDFSSFYKHMKNNGVDKSVVFPNISNIKKFSELNKNFIEEFINSEYKEFYYPFLLIDASDEITLEQIKTEQIYGIKYHPSISQRSIDDISLVPFFNQCRKKNIPILCHCGRNEISHIKYLCNAAKKNPDINFIGAHLGGNATDIIEESLDILKKEKINNIYLDTSAGKLPRLIEYAVEVLGENKIIFGSDEPYADIRIQQQCVKLSKLPKRVKRYIFSDNIISLLFNE